MLTESSSLSTGLSHGTNGAAGAGAAARSARDAREFMSVADTIAAFGISRSFFYELAKGGGFRTAKVGRRRLVHAPSFRAFILSDAGV
jgi:Helix-turn-helix domain